MRKADVIVIGGGVIGGSIAYHLAKAGQRVTVLEKNRVGREASAAAAGMLGAQVENATPGAMYRLCLESRRRFPQLAATLLEETGIDIELNTNGMLRVAADAEEQKQLQERAVWQQQYGQTVKELSYETLRQKEKLVHPDILGGYALPDDGQVSAIKLTQAYFEGAARLGADIREYHTVHRLQKNPHALNYVETDSGTFEGRYFILAAGCWSPSLATSLGIDIPVKPLKGELFSVRSRPPLIRHTLYMNGCYIVPKRDGTLYVGATQKDVGFDQKVTLGGIRELLDRGTRLLPAIEEHELAATWTGLRPYSEDGLPFIGRVPRYPNLILATGHFRNGILLSPITGEWVTSLVHNGSFTSSFQDPFYQTFSPERLSRTSSSSSEERRRTS